MDYHVYGGGWPGRVLERRAMLEIRLERGALKAVKGLERGAILEMPGAWSAEGKIGRRSAERQGQKGSERGALFTPGPLPMLAETAQAKKRKNKNDSFFK